MINIEKLKKQLYKKQNNNYFISLELFASAEDEGRTEEPSQYKIRKAREEGKVARSQELVSSLVLLISFITIWFLSDHFFESSKKLFYGTIDRIGASPINEGNITVILKQAVWDFFILTSPILIVTVVIATLANVIQVGFMFSLKSMKFDAKKISFTTNKMFSKIFVSKQTLVNLIKSVLKVGIVIFVAYSIVNWNKELILNAINMDVMNSFSTMTNMSFYIGVSSCLIFLVLSVPDYFYQKREHMESLKMSRHEMKEERKDTEGDPLIRGRLRERQREIMANRMMEEVPKADVIITNPIHYAVAIKYDTESMSAPIVVAKGQDYIALKIKEIAIENDVHIVENKPLAQSLYSACEIGNQIPENFYQAIAEVLAFVIRAKEAVRV